MTVWSRQTAEQSCAAGCSAAESTIIHVSYNPSLHLIVCTPTSILRLIVEQLSIMGTKYAFKRISRGSGKAYLLPPNNLTSISPVTVFSVFSWHCTMLCCSLPQIPDYCSGHGIVVQIIHFQTLSYVYQLKALEKHFAKSKSNFFVMRDI